MEVRAQGNNVPPGDRSGTIRANYLEIPNITPIGGIVLWAGTSGNLPTGTVNGSIVTNWLVCSGQELSVVTYSSLYAIIGTTYGGTGGSNGKFKLPDLRNKFVVGSSANTGSNVSGEILRNGGSKDIELIEHNHQISEITDHTHGVEVAQDDANHNHEHNHEHSLSVQLDEQPATDVPVSGNTQESGGHHHQYSRGKENATPKQPGGGPEPNRGSEDANTGQDGNHTHEFSATGVMPKHNHDVTAALQISVEQISNFATHNHQASSQTAGGHSHGGDTANSGVSGNDGTNKNLPPYYALYYIMRII